MSLSDIVNKIGQIRAFVKQDASVSRELVKAGVDINAQRQVLKNNAMDDFIAGIVDSPGYEPFVKELSYSIIEEHPEVRQEVLDSKLGVKKPIKKPSKPKIKKHKSKTAKGKEYTRGYSTWSTDQETFIRSRKGMSVKELTKQYNAFFEINRSASSISTKRYRLIKR